MNVEQVYAEFSAKNPDFARTQEFRKRDLQEFCAEIGAKWHASLFENTERVAHGVYKYTGVQNVVTIKKDPVVAKQEPILVPDNVLRNSNFGSIPMSDPDYVPFGQYRDIETIIKSKIFYPVLITGHSGNGKTLSVMQACAKLNRAMIRINCTKKTDEESLIGSKTLVDGNVIVVEGPFLTAMRSGSIVLLDEFSASDPNAILMLQGIMEGKPYYFTATGEYVYPAKGFNVFLTDNTKGQGSEDGRYVGTNILNEAFLERIGMTIEQEYPSATVEKKIMLRRMETKGCVNEKFAETLIKWSEAIRRTFADGGIDTMITTRRLGHIVDNYAIFNDTNKAIVDCTARFDEMTKQAFRTLWEKISEESKAAPVEQPAEPQNA